MKRKNTKQKIAEKTFGMINTITDFVLFNLEILAEIVVAPPGSYSMSSMQNRLAMAGLKADSKTVSNVIARARSHGWLKKDMKLTEEGKKRLEELFPVPLTRKPWDKTWHLVIFDIPERLRYKRNILREKLRNLGFGELQKSVWVSPINYLPLLEKIIIELQIDSYVIFSQTTKIGREDAQELAEKIWGLEKINKEYKKFISEWEKTANKQKRPFLQLMYLSVLSQDPQLPQELLPEDWMGDRAHKLIKTSKHNLLFH